MTLPNLWQFCNDEFRYSAWIANRSPKAMIEDLKAEINELERALESKDRAAVLEEAGDVFKDALTLFIGVHRLYGASPESGIRRVYEKFSKRKPHVVLKSAVPLHLERYFWREAKRKQD